MDLIFDISGFNSWDDLGAAVNELADADIGLMSVMTGIGWDVTLTTVGASWLSEADLYLRIAAIINIKNPAAITCINGDLITTDDGQRFINQ